MRKIDKIFNDTSQKVIQYEYDLLGRRAGKIVNDIAASETRTVKYAYDGDDILYEFDGDNDLQARHTHGPGVDDPLYTQAVGDSGGPGDFYYYHKDGMNSVREITDENGEVVQRLDYDSFGNILTINGCAYDPAANTITTETGGGGSSTETYAPPHDFFHTYSYTGRQWDPETGLYYYRARYYDASIGRFISEDPQWNVNPYTYVKNNPIKYGDPSGGFVIAFWVLTVFLPTAIWAGLYGVIYGLTVFMFRNMSVSEINSLHDAITEPDEKTRTKGITDEIKKIRDQYECYSCWEITRAEWGGIFDCECEYRHTNWTGEKATCISPVYDDIKVKAGAIDDAFNCTQACEENYEYYHRDNYYETPTCNLDAGNWPTGFHPAGQYNF